MLAGDVEAQLLGRILERRRCRSQCDLMAQLEAMCRCTDCARMKAQDQEPPEVRCDLKYRCSDEPEGTYHYVTGCAANRILAKAEARACAEARCSPNAVIPIGDPYYDDSPMMCLDSCLETVQGGWESTITVRFGDGEVATIHGVRPDKRCAACVAWLNAKEIGRRHGCVCCVICVEYRYLGSTDGSTACSCGSN